MRPTRAIGVYHRAPRGLEATKGGQVPSRSIECPECKAAVGQPCITVNGTPYSGGSVHPARKRMATRALLASRQEAS